jgi:hypothetical protein
MTRDGREKAPTSERGPKNAARAIEGRNAVAADEGRDAAMDKEMVRSGILLCRGRRQ